MKNLIDNLIALFIPQLAAVGPSLEPYRFVRVPSGGSQLASDEVILIQNLQNGSYQSETPGGSVNGSNTAFTLAAAPSPAASLFLFLNGARLEGGGVDYTLSSANLTMTYAPQTGDILRAYYLRDA